MIWTVYDDVAAEARADRKNAMIDDLPDITDYLDDTPATVTATINGPCQWCGIPNPCACDLPF